MIKNWKYRLVVVIAFAVTIPYSYMWFFEHFSGSLKERLFGSFLLTIIFTMAICLMLMIVKEVYEWIMKYR